MIRTATPSDINEIIKILEDNHEIIYYDYEVDYLNELITTEGCEYLVFIKNDEIAGCLTFSPRGLSNSGWILSINVLSSERNKGIATEMINAIIERVKSKRFESLLLDVKKDNPARNLYYKLGFKEIENSSLYYTMRKTLC